MTSGGKGRQKRIIRLEVSLSPVSIIENSSTAQTVSLQVRDLEPARDRRQQEEGCEEVPLKKKFATSLPKRSSMAA